MFDDELLQDWMAYETFRILSDDYQQCPACEIGILNPTGSEDAKRLACDVCDEVCDCCRWTSK